MRERADRIARRQLAVDYHAGVEDSAFVADLDVGQMRPRIDLAISSNARIALEDNLWMDDRIAPDLDGVVDVGRIGIDDRHSIGHQAIESLVSHAFPHPGK